MKGEQLSYSIVIPCYNEEESLSQLVKEISLVALKEKLGFEIIFVNDGSKDNTLDTLISLKKEFTDLKIIIIDFSVNAGKANALHAGFEIASGDYIFTLDADLQDDPAEIPNFIKEMGDGKYGMITGWKFNRLDPIGKTLPSKIANNTLKFISGVKVHDMNCGFKLYRAEAAKSLNLYGDMHRFIPALLSSKGFRIGEIKVNHRKRVYGKSKYGAWRLITSFFDMLTVVIRTKFLEKPLHFFGPIGFFIIFASFLSLIYLFIEWLVGNRPIGDRPLLMFSLIMFSLGFQIIMTGLIGELLILRIPKKEYTIRKIYK